MYYMGLLKGFGSQSPSCLGMCSGICSGRVSVYPPGGCGCGLGRAVAPGKEVWLPACQSHGAFPAGSPAGYSTGPCCLKGPVPQTPPGLRGHTHQGGQGHCAPKPLPSWMGHPGGLCHHACLCLVVAGRPTQATQRALVKGPVCVLSTQGPPKGHVPQTAKTLAWSCRPLGGGGATCHTASWPGLCVQRGGPGSCVSGPAGQGHSQSYMVDGKGTTQRPSSWDS